MWKVVVFREAGGHCGIHEGGGYALPAVGADQDGDVIPVDSSAWRLQCLCMRQYMRECICVAFKGSCVYLLIFWLLILGILRYKSDLTALMYPKKNT